MVASQLEVRINGKSSKVESRSKEKNVHESKVEMVNANRVESYIVIEAEKSQYQRIMHPPLELPLAGFTSNATLAAS